MKIFALFLGALALTVPAQGIDWPIFRGPNNDGISREKDWDTTPSKAEIAWKTKVGLGYSAPTVSKGKVFVTGHDGKDSDRVFCFDEKTGSEIWVHSYPQPKGDLYFQGGTTASVTIDGDLAYHVAREGEVFCLNTENGDVIWSTHLQKDHDYSKPTWGFSGAPLIHGDRVVLTAGESGLVLNKATGEVIWKSEDEEAGYATPYLFEKNGTEYYIFTNKRYYNCVVAEGGEKVWEVKWMTRYGVNAADPIVSGDYIFISTGYGKGATLLKWTGSGYPETLWRSRDMRTQMNACVLIGDYLYGVDGNESVDGTGLKCMEMQTGKIMWSDTSIGHGTMTVADGNLIVLSEQGELHIAPVSKDGFSPVFTEHVIPGRVWTVPVLANGRVYCRNEAGDIVVVDLSL